MQSQSKLANETLNMDTRVPDPDTEPDAVRALGQCQETKAKGGARPIVRIERRAVRLLDRENLWGSAKGIVDCLRYARLIADDSEKDIDLQVTQMKVAKKDIGTMIEIEWP